MCLLLFYFDHVPIGYMPILLLFMLTSLFLPSSSASLCYFIIAVPMLECLGKHSFMRSTFPIAMMFFFHEAKQSLLWLKRRLSKAY